MTHAALLDLWRSALVTTLMIGGPFVVAALLVGLLASLLQAATQLQENILSFAPKIVVVGVVLALGGHWLLDQMLRYTTDVAEAIVRVGQSGGHG